MRTLAIIPARYASTRFPGKPLALLGGKPVIEWVWECVNKLPMLSNAVVATDDRRIADTVEAFGGRAMMTSDQHRSGTDRCGEVLERLEMKGEEYDVVVNVQGDEPFVQQHQLESLVACFDTDGTEIATLKTAIGSKGELMSANNVKVVCDRQGRALYFSRQPIPYLRGAAQEEWLQRVRYYKHVGIYAFRAATLKELVKLPQTPLELSESLEQLRWLENGYGIRVCETETGNIGIDTPEDLKAAEQYLANNRSTNKI
ncbi:MAG: 3-deoxy-manno-octulosonate cytidylyltransferase [Bacteroidales bacterium]|nr:3-deoxy-manno-octulosonate cytidylyltransferase [Bacteroidales bacterium]